MENKELMLAEQAEKIDRKVDKCANSLLEHLGYEIFENMTFEQTKLLNQQMQQNGHKLDVHAEQNGTSYVVEIQLTQTLKFELEE